MSVGNEGERVAEHARLVFQLARAGLSIEAIATTLGLPVEVVRSLLERR